MSSKTFEGGTVAVNFEDGKPVGSRIKTDMGTLALPHWPSRIDDVKAVTENLIVVETKSGPRYFGPDDIVEAGGCRVAETSAGGSMGGNDPRAHGKLRYIVRAFGSWAKGKQHVCVQRIQAEHPEIVKGKNPNALCAWLKDQWAGTTKWRGSKADPKQVAEDTAIEKRARASAPARFTHALPEMSHAELDMLVEAFSKEKPIETMVRELGLDAGEDPYVALWEHDVAASSAAIVEATRKVAAGEDLVDSVGTWLAAHADVRPLVEGQLREAAERITSTTGPEVARNDLDGRVQKALGMGRIPEPWEVGTDTPVTTRAIAEADLVTPTRTERKSTAVYQLPPIKEARKTSGFVEQSLEEIDTGEAKPIPRRLREMSFEDLQDRARALYDQTAEPTREGKQWILSAGRNELSRIVEAIEQLLEDDPSTEETTGDAADVVGWEREDSKEVTDVDTVTLRVPPNLRRGYFSADRGTPRRCGACYFFSGGTCRAYAGYGVSEGELCDSFSAVAQLNEAEPEEPEPAPLPLTTEDIIDRVMESTSVSVGAYQREGKPVKSYTRTLSSGSSGPLVAGVRSKLPGAKGSGNEYNAALVKEVEEFQQKKGILVDGVVGTQTVAALKGEAKGVKPGALTKADRAYLKEAHVSEAAATEIVEAGVNITGYVTKNGKHVSPYVQIRDGVSTLMPGAELHMPDGTIVRHKVEGGYRVQNGDHSARGSSHADTAQGAAVHAVRRSARKFHPASVGGAEEVDPKPYLKDEDGNDVAKTVPKPDPSRRKTLRQVKDRQAGRKPMSVIRAENKQAREKKTYEKAKAMTVAQLEKQVKRRNLVPSYQRAMQAELDRRLKEAEITRKRDELREAIATARESEKAGKDVAAEKADLRRRAQSLGATGMLPGPWKAAINEAAMLEDLGGADVAVAAVVIEAVSPKAKWPAKLERLLPGSGPTAAQLSPGKLKGAVRVKVRPHTRGGKVKVSGHMRGIAEAVKLDAESIAAMERDMVEAGVDELGVNELVGRVQTIIERAVIWDLLEGQVGDDVGELDEQLMEADADKTLSEAKFGKFVGHQLMRRVKSGAITRGQAVKTARQRKSWKKQYGKNWRTHVFGPHWSPGSVRKLRTKLFTPAGGSVRAGSPPWKRYKGMMARRRRSAGAVKSSFATGSRGANVAPATHFGEAQVDAIVDRVVAGIAQK